MKRHSLALPASERWEYPEDAYSRLDFVPLRHISSSLDVARPLTNKVEKGWKKYTDMVGGARSITLYDACTVHTLLWQSAFSPEKVVISCCTTNKVPESFICWLFFFFLFIQLFIIHPSMHPCIHPCMHSFIHLFLHSSIPSFV